MNVGTGLARTARTSSTCSWPPLRIHLLSLPDPETLQTHFHLGAGTFPLSGFPRLHQHHVWRPGPSVTAKKWPSLTFLKTPGLDIATYPNISWCIHHSTSQKYPSHGHPHLMIDKDSEEFLWCCEESIFQAELASRNLHPSGTCWRSWSRGASLKNGKVQMIKWFDSAERPNTTSLNPEGSCLIHYINTLKMKDWQF